MTKERCPMLARSSGPLLADALPVAFYATDADGWITFYNEAAAAVWGRRPALGEERWYGSLRIWTLDGVRLPHDQCPMAVAIKGNRPVRNVQALAERPDGTFVRLAPLPTPIQDESGRLLSAINVLLDVATLSRVCAPPADPQPCRLGLLSQREREVADGVVAGQSTKFIARGLGISPRTVEVHRRNMMSKLGVRNVADLVRMSLQGSM